MKGFKKRSTVCAVMKIFGGLLFWYTLYIDVISVPCLQSESDQCLVIFVIVIDVVLA